jgi:peptidoglycan/LPS O-acetylase OafA/YrhL
VTDTASTSAVIPRSRNNSFGFTRFVAAAGVIFSHHFPISGFTEPNIAGFTVGAISVYVFFLTSGYLICKSILGNPDFYRFVSARILRIIPNLFVVLTLTSVVTLVYYSNTAHWIKHLRYVVQNLFMLVRGGPYYQITGVFEERPLHALNGSLWSLPYEVWCYFILFGILTLSAAARRQAVAGALLVCILVYWLPDIRFYPLALSSGHFAVLGGWFFMGATLAVFSLNIPLLSSPAMAWFAKWGDPSYGMYILAWPVQQFCSAHIENFWASMASAMVIVTALGYATWHGFERTAVGEADNMAAWLKTKLQWRR